MPCSSQLGDPISGAAPPPREIGRLADPFHFDSTLVRGIVEIFSNHNHPPRPASRSWCHHRRARDRPFRQHHAGARAGAETIGRPRAGPKTGPGMVVRGAVSLGHDAEVGRLFGSREDCARQCAGQGTRDRARGVWDRSQKTTGRSLAQKKGCHTQMPQLFRRMLELMAQSTTTVTFIGWSRCHRLPIASAIAQPTLRCLRVLHRNRPVLNGGPWGDRCLY